MDARITDQPIDAAALLRDVPTPADGALLLFVGLVREQNDERPVTGMRYDAYVEMAERVLAEIVAEARERAGGRVAAVHRVGELAVGEASVAVVVATPHRAEAYDASRYLIEEIKKRLPVWKHEHYADGDARWLDGVVPETARVR